LNQLSYIDSHVLLRACGGNVARERSQIRGTVGVRDPEFSPRAGHLRDIHAASHADRVHKERHRRLADLRACQTGGQAAEIELNQSCVSAADVNRGGVAKVAAGLSRADIGIGDGICACGPSSDWSQQHRA
jgi:hypothetical protein